MSDQNAQPPKNEHIIDLKAADNGAKFFEKHGWVADLLKQTYSVVYSQKFSKLHISGEDAENAKKAVEITKRVLSRQAIGKEVTEKYVQSMITPEQAVQTKTVTKQNGKVVKKPVPKHPLEIELDLKSGQAVNELFNTDRQHIKMVRAIFQTEIDLAKGSTITIRPTGKPKRAAREVSHDKMLVEQAANVMKGLARSASVHELITPNLIGVLAATAVDGAPNQQKTMGKIQKAIGSIHFPEQISDESQENKTVDQTKQDKESKQKNVYLGGDFGDMFSKDIAIKGMFERKLKMEMSYYGKDGKRLTLTKKKGCDVNFDKAEQVVMYSQEMYNDLQGSLNPALVDNAIDNVLADRPVGFIDQNKHSDLVVSNRRQQYKLSTYNRAGENINMYPKTESQYAISDLLMGKPTRDQKNAYYTEGAKIAMLIGPAASGKTSWSIWNAIHAFKQGWIENVYLCRPDVMKQAPLPGDLKTKTAMAMAPLYENLEKVMPASESAKWIREPVPPGTPVPIVQGRDPTDRRKIEINSVPMMRGRTIENGVMIVDEAQNCTYTEIKTLMTRIGKGGSAIFSFDLEQIDLFPKRQSGALNAIIATYEAQQRAKPPKFVKMLACNGNLRHEVVDEVLDIFHAFDTYGEETTREKRLYTVDNQYEQALKIYWGTSDQEKIKQLQQNEKKYGLEATGYAPHAANKRDANVINFQNASMELMISKTVTATVEALSKNGMLVQQPKVG